MKGARGGLVSLTGRERGQMVFGVHVFLLLISPVVSCYSIACTASLIRGARG